MRIIAGEWRGRRLEVPKGIRPMQDRERERMFAMIGPGIEGAVFLDLFAGTGAAGLEALSRGAARAIVVENGRRVLACLRRNVEKMGAQDRISLLDLSALALPRTQHPGEHSIDLAVCTPPFPLLKDPARERAFRRLFDHVMGSLLVPEGVMVLEHPARFDPAPLVERGEPGRSRRTAASAITFFQAPARPETPS